MLGACTGRLAYSCFLSVAVTAILGREGGWGGDGLLVFAEFLSFLGGTVLWAINLGGFGILLIFSNFLRS